MFSCSSEVFDLCVNCLFISPLLQIHAHYELKKSSRHRRNLAITGGVALSIITAPVIAAVSVGEKLDRTLFELSLLLFLRLKVLTTVSVSVPRQVSACPSCWPTCTAWCPSLCAEEEAAVSAEGRDEVYGSTLMRTMVQSQVRTRRTSTCPVQWSSRVFKLHHNPQ